MSFQLLLQRLKRREGTALVISLLLLTSIYLIGVYAVFTSTVETRIAGNERLLEAAFYAADGGSDYGRNMIELVMSDHSPDFPGGSDPQPGEDEFIDEILGFADSDPDPWVRPSIGNCEMTIPVGRIKAESLAGGSAEFGASEETTKAVYYLIGSTATGVGESQSRVQTTYRRIIE